MPEVQGDAASATGTRHHSERQLGNDHTVTAYRADIFGSHDRQNRIPGVARKRQRRRHAGNHGLHAWGSGIRSVFGTRPQILRKAGIFEWQQTYIFTS